MKGNAQHVAAYVLGAIAAAVGAFVYVLTSDAYSMCTSGTGALAQAFSSQAAARCTVLGFIHSGALTFLAMGRVGLIIGAILQSGQRRG